MIITTDNLPSGSGFDTSWILEEKKGYTKASSAYHVMNDTGYYVGWVSFSVIIPKKDPTAFRLHFHGRYSHYLNSRYMLRESMEDTLYYSLKGEW